MQIERDKSIRFQNLLSLRKKMSQADIQTELNNIAKKLKIKGIQKNGPLITATFNSEVLNGEQVFDMEILVPIDKKVDLPDGYRFKEEFYLVHALYLRYEGDLSGLEKAYQELYGYIRANNLHQITASYSFHMKNPRLDGEGCMNNNVIIDIYTGINPSIL